MPKRSTSVPQVPRPAPPIETRSYSFQFPARDDGQFDEIDQVAFAVQYFVSVAVMVVGLGTFAAFVLVPLAALFFSR